MSMKVTTVKQLDKVIEDIASGVEIDNVVVFFEDTPNWEKRLVVIPNYMDEGKTILLDEKNRTHWVVSKATSLSTAEDIFSYYY